MGHVFMLGDRAKGSDFVDLADRFRGAVFRDPRTIALYLAFKCP